MSSNNPRFNPQNPNNYQYPYINPSNYPLGDQSSNQPTPQNAPTQSSSQPCPQNYIYPQTGMASAVPNWSPFYQMQMPMPMQAPPPPYHLNPYMPMMRNENASGSQPTEIPVYSTQVPSGLSAGADYDSPTEEVPGTSKKRNSKWTRQQNLVLLSGWMQFSNDSVVGRNQKLEAFWEKITIYCNEHCNFESYRNSASCRNRWNYISAKLSKWVGAYDKAKRMKQSGWSENDVLTKAHELYQSDNKSAFNFMEEWKAVRDEPRYASQLRPKTGSESSGSKRAREDDACDSNSIGSIPRPIGREAAKRKARKKDKGVASGGPDKEEFEVWKNIMEKDISTMSELKIAQEDAVKEARAKTRAKDRKTWVKLSEKDHLNEQQQMLFDQLTAELFGN